MKNATLLFFALMMTALSWQGSAQCSTTIPFAEGFETFNGVDGAVLGGCWTQQSITGNPKWLTRKVSDTYNRSARTGTRYITLMYGNQDWIFYKLDFIGGTKYELKFYAKQDATSEVQVEAKFGTTGNAAGMTNTIIATSEVTNGNYQEFSGVFTPLTSGVYYIGIKGTVGSNVPWYLTMDDISVEVAPTPPDPGFVYDNGWNSKGDPSGVSTYLDDITIVNGIATLTANTESKNLIINSGATLNVNKLLEFVGDMTIDGNLIFVSNANENGELGAVLSSSTITGNATVQRYMSDHRSYRMVSSPVTTLGSIHANWQEGADSNTNNPHPGFGTHITGTHSDQEDGFDATSTGNPSMFFVPYGSQSFQKVPNTDELHLVAGDPFLLYVRGNRSIDLSDNLAHSETILRATGELYTGPHTRSFNSGAGDFIMFGNPYQCAVDVTRVLANSDNINDNQYYIYDATIATEGAYRTVDLTNISQYIYLQPGQAAQVAVTGPATIEFNEIDKEPGKHNDTNRSPMSGSDKLNVDLYTTENFNNGGPIHDNFLMRFAEDFDNGLTLTDAVKPMNFYENLGIDHDGTYLSIERRAMPQPEEIYQLYSTGYNYSEYTLKMTLDGLDDTFLYLDDNFTGTSTLLEVGETVYSFNIDANDPLSKATDRFSIRTEARLGVNDNNLLAGIRLFPNPMNDNTFFIAAPKLNGETAAISVNDMLGREVFKSQQAFSGNTVKVELSQELKSGVYLVTISSNGESQTLRVIKQ